MSRSHVLRSRELALCQIDTSPFSPDQAEIILRYGAPVGSRLEYHGQLDRCMGRLQELMGAAEQKKQTLAAGTVVVAETLTRSMGRFARSWHAPAGGAWLAMAWPDTLLPEFARLLPFAVGLACCRAVRAVGVTADLKWVNDILVAGKKIGGILCQTVLSPGGERFHLLGMGINGNNTVFPDELVPVATCLSEELGARVDVSSFIGHLLAELSWSIGLLHYDEQLSLGQQTDRARSFPFVMQSWLAYCDSLGRRVEYGFDVQETPMYQALVLGVDPCGGLQMELDDGSLITESSGEIRYL